MFGAKPQKSRTSLSEDEFSNSSSSSSRTRSSSSSSSSGSSYPGSGKAYSEVRNSRRYRRTIKSGARVKTRPVVKTELWPHTIANEEDGENVNSESIRLAKFLSCFTHIMTDCEGFEAKGRAKLLHGVSTILEYLPWKEARTFHNLVMLKIEQDRICWKTNFLLMANQFLDKKVRENLRKKGQTLGYSKTNSLSCTSLGNDFSMRNTMGKNKTNTNNYLYPIVCKQWNYGFCSYGDHCKKEHVCWSCAEAGNMGESHKATDHDNDSTEGSQDHQQL